MGNLKDTGERLIPELHKQSLAYGEHLARYRAAEGLTKDKVVLDIASGAGYGTALLATSARKVIGVDYDGAAIEYAKQLYPIKNVEFIEGNAEALPLDTNSVDVVVSLETIEHIPNPEKFVQEVVRVLRPDGFFYVSTPNDNEFTEGNEFHLHEFDLAELRRLITKYFKQSDYYYQGTWFASGILDKQNFEHESTPLETIKTFDQKVGKAIYYLAVASNLPAKDLPRLKQNVVASDRFSELTAQRQHHERVKSADAAQAEITRLRDENEAVKSEIRRINQELGAVYQSKSWKLVSKLRAVRHRLP